VQHVNMNTFSNETCLNVIRQCFIFKHIVQIHTNTYTIYKQVSKCLLTHEFSAVISDRLLSCSADGTLFHTVGPWKAELRWPTNVCTLGSSIHPVDADCSRGHPWTFSTSMQNSCRCGRFDAIDAFPYKDRSLENDPSLHRKPVEAAYE